MCRTPQRASGVQGAAQQLPWGTDFGWGAPSVEQPPLSFVPLLQDPFSQGTGRAGQWDIQREAQRAHRT